MIFMLKYIPLEKKASKDFYLRFLHLNLDQIFNI